MKNVPDNTQSRIAELESFMRSHFRRFESKRPVETEQEGLDVIGTLEKMRLFIVYRNTDWARAEREKAKRTYEKLRIWYHVE